MSWKVAVWENSGEVKSRFAPGRECLESGHLTSDPVLPCQARHFQNKHQSRAQTNECRPLSNITRRLGICHGAPHWKVEKNSVYLCVRTSTARVTGIRPYKQNEAIGTYDLNVDSDAIFLADLSNWMGTKTAGFTESSIIKLCSTIHYRSMSSTIHHRNMSSTIHHRSMSREGMPTVEDGENRFDPLLRSGFCCNVDNARLVQLNYKLILNPDGWHLATEQRGKENVGFTSKTWSSGGGM
ncbi:hypothetical protein J6590_035442 [Homalodisca vitripennis]|nr:hypothetical protein J6590_035442 [Homalodisca vitripennis]